MLAKTLRGLFGGDAFVPTSAVFPSIDAEAIARDLKVDAEAKQRGKRELPPTDQADLDSLELKITNVVSELRLKGIENYNLHRSSYAKRMAATPMVLGEVRDASNKAKADFTQVVAKRKNSLAGDRMRLSSLSKALDGFRDRHRLDGPAQDGSGWLGWAAVALPLLVFESAGNGYFFAAGNELGLLGGFLVAFLVALANIGVATIVGRISTHLVHRSFLRKIGGFLAVVFGILFAFGFNLGVGHFRDALASGIEWQAAQEIAMAQFASAPFDFHSIETWLLIILGVLSSLIAAWKAAGIDDPYPGYGRRSRALDDARADYVDGVHDAVDELEKFRNDATEDFAEARRIARNAWDDSAGAQAGGVQLAANLRVFLDHGERAANQLLARYRDANRAARTTPAPPHFAQPHRFEPFEPGPLEAPPADATRHALREVETQTREASDEIHAVWLEALREFASVDDVEARQLLAPIAAKADA